MTTPPAAKVAAAKGEAWQGIIGQITELAVAGMATRLLFEGKISTEVWVGLCAATIIGPGIGKARGKPPMSSLVTLGVVTPVLVKTGLVKFLPLA